MEVCILISQDSKEDDALRDTPQFSTGAPFKAGSEVFMLLGRLDRIDDGLHYAVQFVVGDLVYLDVLEESPMLD